MRVDAAVGTAVMRALQPLGIEAALAALTARERTDDTAILASHVLHQSCSPSWPRRGLASSNHFEAGGLIRGNQNVAYPNLQYHFGPAGYEYEGTKLELRQAFMLQVVQLRPRSRGHIALKSADPGEKPAMFFRYLSDPDDLRELVEGVKKMRELVSQAAFDDLRGAELIPEPDVRTEAEIEEEVCALTGTDFHPWGTCRMSHGADGVVDSELRVHGM